MVVDHAAMQIEVELGVLYISDRVTGVQDLEVWPHIPSDIKYLALCNTNRRAL